LLPCHSRLVIQGDCTLLFRAFQAWLEYSGSSDIWRNSPKYQKKSFPRFTPGYIGLRKKKLRLSGGCVKLGSAARLA
jgi:hypothetical protein